MLIRHTGIAEAGVGLQRKTALPSSLEVGLDRPEERNERAFFSPSSAASGTKLGEKRDLPENRHLLRLCCDFFCPMKIYFPLCRVTPVEGIFRKAAICRGIDALCLL